MLRNIILSGTAILALAACQTTTPESAAVNEPAYKKMETIKYVSTNVNSFHDVFQGNAVYNVTLKGKLYLPQGEGPFPVVVWQHGSGPPDSSNGAKWRSGLKSGLMQEQIGLFIANSYSGRGIRSTSRNQSLLSGTSRVVDAMMALDSLAKHPRVDADKIGISGNSYGGMVSYRVTHKPHIDKILPNGPRYAAHVPISPACNGQFERYESTGAPILILTGEKDDWTPAQPCVDLVKKHKADGVDADIIVYPDSHHGFHSTSSVRYKSQVINPKGCGIYTFTREGFTEMAGVSTKDIVDQRKFHKHLLETGCLTRGAHSGGNAKAAKDALQQTVAFFVKHLNGKDKVGQNGKKSS